MYVQQWYDGTHRFAFVEMVEKHLSRKTRSFRLVKRGRRWLSRSSWRKNRLERKWLIWITMSDSAPLFFQQPTTPATTMISSRILRNIGSTGNRLMNETGPKERTMVRLHAKDNFFLRGPNLHKCAKKKNINFFYIALCCWCLGRLDSLSLLGWVQSSGFHS